MTTIYKVTGEDMFFNTTDNVYFPKSSWLHVKMLRELEDGLAILWPLENNDEISERTWRDLELKRADIEILKLEDLGEDQTPWRQYRILLRVWPEDANFPDKTFRPTEPDNTQESS